MFNVCPKCGEYRVDKMILADENIAICPVCGFRQPFIRLPLFIITGASGTGKSTVCLELAAQAKDVVVIESDILWSEEFNKLENDYRNFRELCLRVSKNISQAGKPVVLCGSAIPSQFEATDEVRYFQNIHYLALVCDAKTLEKRLKERPTWRKSGTDENIGTHIAFNQWFVDNAAKTVPQIDLIDTSNINLDQTVERAKAWIDKKVSL
jgi:broad-specificity NMP kinase